jgi:hypothetical protein
VNEQAGLDIHDHVNELTRTHQHVERYEDRQGLELWTKQHVTTAPSLIMQLICGTPASQGSDSGSATFASRPAARIEAIDTAMLIDDEASRWLYRLGADDPNERPDPITGQPMPGVRASTGQATINVVNKLHGLHASAESCGHEKPRRNKKGRPDCCNRHHIEHDVKRWWTQARIVSGWDSPAWRPDNTCPVCDVRRSLRVNLSLQTALCVECREVWDSTTIGLLAEHIRAENMEDEEATA